MVFITTEVVAENSIYTIKKTKKKRKRACSMDNN